jgi:hypothetical protein
MIKGRETLKINCVLSIISQVTLLVTVPSVTDVTNVKGPVTDIMTRGPAMTVTEAVTDIVDTIHVTGTTVTEIGPVTEVIIHALVITHEIEVNGIDIPIILHRYLPVLSPTLQLLGLLTQTHRKTGKY